MTVKHQGEALLGIDVGTTNVKAAAYDLQGGLLSGSASRLPTKKPRPGWEEYDPEELFSYTANAVRSVLAGLPENTKILGVAVASMAETAVPLDAKAQVLHNAVAWHDERSLPQADWWREEVGAEKIFGITGLPPIYIFGVNKLLWYKENAPEAYARTSCWLNVADYIAYRLCGVQATDLSLASRLMLLDLKTGKLSDELLTAGEIPKSLFADLVPSGQKLGTVHAEAEAATGLRRGTSVVAGGHDHPCGALALGITQPGDILDSTGTSESIFSVTNDLQLSPDLARTGYQLGFHVVPQTYYCNGGLYTMGRCVEWLRELLLPADENAYQELVALASSAPMGSNGVYFLPHLRMAHTPIDDARSRGAFVGLSVSSSRENMVRAVFEGLAYEAHYALEGLEECFGIRSTRIRAIGGGTRNPLLMAIKASLLGFPIEVINVDEATTLGAAMLAGVGSGVYANAIEATQSVKPSSTLVEVDSALSGFYKHAYEKVYKRLYPHIAPVSHAIGEVMTSSITQ